MISVLGDGAWGTAIASALAANNHETTLWCHNQEVAEGIRTTHYNTRYLPNFKLSAKITPTTSLEEALGNKTVLVAIPVQFLRALLQKCTPYVQKDQIFVCLSKGIEAETLLFPSQIITDTMSPHIHVAALSGPSYAHDLAAKQPTGFVIASSDQHIGQKISTLFKNNFVFPELSADILGIQLGGALKNIFALGTGMLAGAGYGENTQVLMSMRAFQELETLAIKLGCKRETLYGLAGVGDMILTCFGSQSRNYKVGFMLGQGKKLEAILQETGAIPEGINTLKSIAQLAKKHDTPLPICTKIRQIIFDDNPVATLAT